MIKIYHNPRCSKSRAGLALLEASGKPFEVVKYLEDVPTKEVLQQLLGYLKLDAIHLVRKNEAIWKTHYKEKNLSNDAIIEAMVKHPKLIERPIVINGNTAIIGRPTERIHTIL